MHLLPLTINKFNFILAPGSALLLKDLFMVFGTKFDGSFQLFVECFSVLRPKIQVHLFFYPAFVFALATSSESWLVFVLCLFGHALSELVFVQCLESLLHFLLSLARDVVLSSLNQISALEVHVCVFCGQFVLEVGPVLGYLIVE